MSKHPHYCGDCPFLEASMRTDFYPSTVSYTCGVLDQWIGFVADRRLSVCLPVLNCNCQPCQSTPLKSAASIASGPTS